MAQELAELLARLADVARAVDTGSVETTLERIVASAVDVVPGCEKAVITGIRGKRLETRASTDAVASRFAAMQLEVDEGPCLDALRGVDLLQVDVLATDPRWPRFARDAARQTGIASILAVRLFTRGQTLGSLNLLSATPSAFADDDLAIAALFGAVAAVALNAAESEAGLEIAVQSRDVIGRAKGILMERHKITDDEAFRRLAAASQRMNVRLVQIAEEVARTGEEVRHPPR